ncbi:MAG: hypothetical protein ACC653_12945 [Gammaproteobacteria bacterium]
MTTKELFRYVRILILLIILFIVAMSTWLSDLRSTDWDAPLWVVIYPINGDGSEQTSRYINYLTKKTFSPIEAFIAEEADYFNIKINTPLQVKLAPTVVELPPLPPENGNVLKIMFWSLKIRYWAYQHNTFAGPSPDIKIFVVYHDPATNSQLAHSLGLKKGKLGIVNAFSNRLYNQKNNVVITHELLHTIGATDKYILETGQPVYPDGYAKPDKKPLHPQELAEIMGARIPLSESRARMPNGLNQTLVGNVTAIEIGWED